MITSACKQDIVDIQAQNKSNSDKQNPIVLFHFLQKQNHLFCADPVSFLHPVYFLNSPQQYLQKHSRNILLFGQEWDQKNSRQNNCLRLVVLTFRSKSDWRFDSAEYTNHLF